MSADQKKYNSMENLLNKINKDFISLSEQDRKRNNEILKSIITQITQKMKESDSLFKEMFTSIFYGGSFYDGLKVAHPDEYDLDLLLTLPSPLKFKVAEASNVPGFVHLKFLDYAPSLQHLDLDTKHKGIDKMINGNHYLVTSKVLQWMQKVLQLALNMFPKDASGRYILKTPHGDFFAKIYKSGPAHTLKATATIEDKTVNMDIDLVPCFVFPASHWPQGHFRKNPVDQKPNFFIVPRQIKGMANTDHYWSLSFQKQERVLLDGKEKLKPTIKLLKKMRDMLQHKTIASYYIKTVALWMAEDMEASFWKKPLSYVFMTTLKKYQEYLESGKIPYYWNKHYNLIGKIDKVTLFNINYKIKAIIADVERQLDNPLAIAKYLVSPQEVLLLKIQTEV